MADGLYLKHGNQEFGPMDTKKLRQLAAQNKISPTDLIRRGTDGKWTPLSNVKGLFPEQPQKVIPVPTGVASTPIITPPHPTQVSAPPLSSSMSFENLGNAPEDEPHRTAKHGSKRGKKKQPMDQKTILIASIVGGVVLLLIVIGLLCFVLFPKKKQDTKPTDNSKITQKSEEANNSPDTQVVADGENPKATTDEENAQKPADGENADGEKADGTAPADKVANAEANKSEAAEDEQKATSAPKNAIESTEVGKAGDLEIKITSVRRGVQNTIQKDGTEDISEDKSTIITLSVKNINEEKTVNFTPWSIGLSRGMKGAALTDNNGNSYPFALKSGEIAEGVKKETATLYSDDPAVTDILVFKRYVPAAKELYLTLAVPGNPKESIVFKIDVANIGKEDAKANPDEKATDEKAEAEKADGENKADDKKADETPAEENTPVANDVADNQADDTNDAEYSELNGVSEEAEKKDQEQADKELKDLNLGDE